VIIVAFINQWCACVSACVCLLFNSFYSANCVFCLSWLCVLRAITQLVVFCVPFSNLEKMLRERFAKTVTRGLVDLEIKQATHSPIENVIEKAVREVRCSIE